MTTIINPSSGDNSSSGVGLVLGVILSLVLIALFFIYGFPAMRNNNAAPKDDINVNIELPKKDVQPTSSTPSPSPGLTGF